LREIATAEDLKGLDVEALDLRFYATVRRYDNGGVAEVFIANHKPSSMAGILASDSAELCPIVLRHGVPIETLRHALIRDRSGKLPSLLGAVLDQLAQEGTTQLTDTAIDADAPAETPRHARPKPACARLLLMVHLAPVREFVLDHLTESKGEQTDVMQGTGRSSLPSRLRISISGG
jgi:hypothetical protein